LYSGWRCASPGCWRRFSSARIAQRNR
jgi:hypothetical protein